MDSSSGSGTDSSSILGAIKELLADLYNNLSSTIGIVISSSYNTLSNVIISLSDFIVEIPSKTFNLFKSLLDGLSNILKNIYDFIIELPSKIWNLFKSAFDSVIDTLKNIWDFFFNFFDTLLEFIKKIFVPHETYFKDKFSLVSSSFSNKFQFISQIDSVINRVKMQQFSVQDLKITFPKYNVDIDFSWYEPYRLKFKNALMGFFGLIFIAGLVKKNDPNINMGGN